METRFSNHSLDLYLSKSMGPFLEKGEFGRFEGRLRLTLRFLFNKILDQNVLVGRNKLSKFQILRLNLLSMRSLPHLVTTPGVAGELLQTRCLKHLCELLTDGVIFCENIFKTP